MSNSKKTPKSNGDAPQSLLDADLLLRACADSYGADDDSSDETLQPLRQAALAFAEAWKACERL